MLEKNDKWIVPRLARELAASTPARGARGLRRLGGTRFGLTPKVAPPRRRGDDGDHSNLGLGVGCAGAIAVLKLFEHGGIDWLELFELGGLVFVRHGRHYVGQGLVFSYVFGIFGHRDLLWSVGRE